MEYYLDGYSLSSPLPSYSSTLRELPRVPAFLASTRTSRRRSTVPGEPNHERHRDGDVHIHVVHLKNDADSPGGVNGNNWATLQVQSKSAKLPVRIAQSHVVQGSLEVNLAKPKSMESIVAEVHGEICVLGDSPTRFLLLEKLLWRSASGGSHIFGRHSLPFVFNLPERISIPKYTFEEVELPFSVAPFDVPFSISYKVVIKMNRGRFKSNLSLEMPLLYMPSSKTPAPSHRRQIAYRDNQIPPGPSTDPEGWYSLGRFVQRGYVFGARIINVVFNCFLANPLSYAKGTTVPFIIVATCDDEQALDLIISRKALSVSLRRKYHLNIDNRVKGKGRNGLKSTTTVGIGSFCPPGYNDNNVPTIARRMIEGEIHISSLETPSFQTSLLSCSYTVDVELKATGFTPFSKSPGDLSDSSLSLFSQEVNITTFPCSGPRPIFRTEPVYPAAGNQDCDGLYLMQQFTPGVHT